jgi:hypothetical protein
VVAWGKLLLDRFGVLGEEMGGQAGHESDGAGLGVGGEAGPDVGGRDFDDRERLLRTHKNNSPIDTSDVGSMGMILSRPGRGRRGEATGTYRQAILVRETIEELAGLTESVEIEEVIGPWRGLAVGREESVPLMAMAAWCPSGSRTMRSGSSPRRTRMISTFCPRSG